MFLHSAILVCSVLVPEKHANPVFYEPSGIMQMRVVDRFDVWDRAYLHLAATDAARVRSGLGNAERRAGVVACLVVWSRRLLGVDALLDAEVNIIRTEAESACKPFDGEVAAWHWVVVGGYNVRVWGGKDSDGMVTYNESDQPEDVRGFLRSIPPASLRVSP